MRDNILTAHYKEGELNNAGTLYQYDYGQRIVFEDIELPEAYEVHFSNDERGEALKVIGDATGVDIPDELLETGKNIHVWVYLHTGEDDGETVYRYIINVRKRAEPTDVTPTPVQQDVITQTIAALNVAVDNAEDFADDAEDHANTAKGYADDAEAAKDFLEKATAEAQTLQPGSQATASYANGVFTFGIPKGDPGEFADIIDDTTGAGTTNKTWSADKLTTQFGGKAAKDGTVLDSTLSRGRKANTTVGEGSEAFGNNVTASGAYSHAEGDSTIADGTGSHAEGSNTVALRTSQHVSGEWNVEDNYNLYHEWVENTHYYVGNKVKRTTPAEVLFYICNTENTDAAFDDEHWDEAMHDGSYAEIVGNGTDEGEGRSNARALDWEGNEYLNGTLYVNCDRTSSNGSKVATESFVTGKMGQASGIATLDSGGKVPTSQLPSYVDDVLEFDSEEAFPDPGETGKIYVAKDTNKTYRWGGSTYVEISASLALGETENTAYRGDRGAEAYAAAVTNVDSTPVASSTNLVTSGGVAAEISGIYDEVDDLIKVQDTEPTEELTKIWLPETAPSGVQVPTYAEFQALDSAAAQPSNTGIAGQILRKTSNGCEWNNAATSEEIGAAVTDWLDENVPTGTTVVVDSSLSISGAAADAKKTGDEFGTVKSAFDNVSTKTRDNTNAWSVGSLAAATGADITSTTRLRMENYVSTGNNIFGFKAKTGYEFLVYAWDKTSGDYVGCMKSGMVIDKTASDYLWITEFYLTYNTNYKYRIVLANINHSATMTTAEATNFLYVARLIDDTLSELNQAADARKTGYTLTAHENSIENGSEKAVYNRLLVFKPGYYKANTIGTATEFTKVNDTVCAICPCEKGDVFTVKVNGSTGVNRSMVVLDENMNVLSRSSNSTNIDGEVTINDNDAAFVVFNNYLSGLASGYYAFKGASVVKGLHDQQNVLNYEVLQINNVIGTKEESIAITADTGYYWNAETSTAVKTSVSTYKAYNPITVNPYEKYKVVGGDADSTKQYMVLIVDENYKILAHYGDRSGITKTYTFSIPVGGKYILLTTKSSWSMSCSEIVLNNITVDALPGVYDFSGKNVAIIGDSISTNGDWSASNLLGNVPEIVIQDEDVGVELSAYATFYDIGTTVGGHEIVAADVGTEITFTPVAGDVGKVVGKPKNNNSASVVTWWEVAQAALGFNPIAVCWSGSSITDHEENDYDSDAGGYIYKCAHAWHPSQIRKCGIRTPGTMNRTAPDMVIIYRGTNDLTHSPFSRITDYIDSCPNIYPANDKTTVNNAEVYDYAKGIRLTIKKLRDAYPGVKIVLCTLNYFLRLHTDAPFTYNSDGDNWKKYNNTIRKVAEQEGCDLIEFDKDGLTWSNAYDGYYQDATNKWTHPTTKGHKVLGNRALRDMMMFNNMT